MKKTEEADHNSGQCPDIEKVKDISAHQVNLQSVILFHVPHQRC